MNKTFISLPDLQNLSAEQQRVAGEVAAGPRGEVRGPVRLWLHSPELADRAQKLGAFFRVGTVLPQRICELAILVTARHYDCDYIWFNHSRQALKHGISAATVEHLRMRQTPSLNEPGDLAVYDFAISMLRYGKVSVPVLDQAVAAFGERGVVELGSLLAHYHSGAIVLSLSDITLPDGSKGCLD